MIILYLFFNTEPFPWTCFVHMRLVLGRKFHIEHIKVIWSYEFLFWKIICNGLRSSCWRVIFQRIYFPIFYRKMFSLWLYVGRTYSPNYSSSKTNLGIFLYVGVIYLYAALGVCVLLSTGSSVDSCRDVRGFNNPTFF